MGIDVNPESNTSPEDRETLRKVYTAQLESYMHQQREAASNAQALAAKIEPLEAERESQQRLADRLLGRSDELRRLAARDGVTLD